MTLKFLKSASLPKEENKRRRVMNFRRNGPLIVKNDFISNWASFSQPKNKEMRDHKFLKFMDDSYWYQENNSMANIVLPTLNEDNIDKSFERINQFHNIHKNVRIIHS